MRRITRRVIVVTVGTLLGWSAAGYVSQGMAGDTVSKDDTTAPAHAGHDEHGSDAAATAATAMLVPSIDQIDWFPAVRTGAVMLFVLAVLLGIPALVLKAPDPPDPAAQDHH